MASIFAGFENLTPESPFVGIDVTPDSSTLDPPPQPERPPSPPLIQATAAPPPEAEFQRLCAEFDAAHARGHTPNEIEYISSLPQHLASGEANPDWLEARLNKFTGSVVGALFGNNPYESPEDALSKLVWRTPFRGNEMTQWGNDHEDDAQAAYALAAGIAESQISNPGLMLNRGEGQFAMSPDGIVYASNMLLEYKCPFRKKWASEEEIRENPDLYPRKLISGSRAGTLPMPHYYHDQIQWGCGLLGLGACDFAVWAPPTSERVEEIARNGTSRTVMTPRGTVQITRVAFDADYFARMKAEMLRLWREVYVPACVWRDACCLDQPDLRPTLKV